MITVPGTLCRHLDLHSRRKPLPRQAKACLSTGLWLRRIGDISGPPKKRGRKVGIGQRKVQFGHRAGCHPVVLAFSEGSAAGGSASWVPGWWVVGVGAGWWYLGGGYGYMVGYGYVYLSMYLATLATLATLAGHPG